MVDLLVGLDLDLDLDVDVDLGVDVRVVSVLIIFDAVGLVSPKPTIPIHSMS